MFPSDITLDTKETMMHKRVPKKLWEKKKKKEKEKTKRR